jgi:hypothetical protein
VKTHVFYSKTSGDTATIDLTSGERACRNCGMSLFWGLVFPCTNLQLVKAAALSPVFRKS